MPGKHLFFLIGSLFILLSASAQDRYFTKIGKITFQSKAQLEDIESQNKTVTAVLDAKSGALQFSVQMKSFEFEKALMHEHFNENYVESDKYPKAEFKGVVSNNAAVNYTQNGTYPVTVKGKLTLHNVTKEVAVPGTIKVDNGKLEALATFAIQLSDYDISIPSVIKNKVANNITILVDAKLDPLKK